MVNGYPGLRRDVLTYLKERIERCSTGTSEAIVVRIFGDDLEVLRSKAEEVGEILGGIEGVIESKVELEVDIPQIEIETDLAAGQRYGLKPGDIRRAAATMLASEEVGDIFRDGKCLRRARLEHAGVARQSRATSAGC